MTSKIIIEHSKVKIMKTMELKNLVELNIVKIEVMKETNEIVGVNDLPTKVRVNIGGNDIEITPAFTDYSMEQPKKKDSLEEHRCRQANGCYLPFCYSRSFLERRYSLV